MKIAKSLNVDLQSCEIQRAHRLGKKTTNNISKPRPNIVQFISHKKRNKISFAKSNLKKTQEFSQVFITEDLTLTWANYGPRAKSGPRACLIWPACYYHERVLKSNSLLIVEYSFRFPYRKITFQCPSIRIN